MRILYFVHDLNDPAVARRIAMLRAGRFDVVATGFWRGPVPPSQIEGARTVPLERTFDSRLVHRGLAALRQMMTSRELMSEAALADLFLARNLEMLAIAVAARRRAGRDPAIIYEVLDIHRSLLSPGKSGKALRLLERLLLRSADLVITSSPAFLREYFEPMQFVHRRLPAAVIENKALCLQPQDQHAHTPALLPGPPWRIGWFGMIRCRRSFEILSNLARKRPDLVRIEIAGRPAQTVFADFEGIVRDAPGMTFAGSYLPADLPRLYRTVHFNWAIDYFEENANSAWLLPNRVYEGGSFNAVPLALHGTETGRWLKTMGLGVLMSDPAAELESFLEQLNPDGYLALKNAACDAPRAAFIADQADCDRLASLLQNAARRRQEGSFGGKVGQAA